MSLMSTFLFLVVVFVQLLSFHPTLVHGAFEVHAKVDDFLDVFQVGGDIFLAHHGECPPELHLAGEGRGAGHPARH